MIKRQLFLLILLAVTIISCRQEESIIQPQGQNLPETLRELMLRVSQSPTAIDNMVDSTSCFRVELPVSLVVNGQQVTVLSEAGYGSVSYILNESTTDADSVEYIFPITITLKNFEQITVEDQQEIDTILTNCDAQNGPQEIVCIDFIYPMTFNTYNSDFQFAETISIGNDQQLYNFLDNFNPAYFAEVIYPVTLSNGLGQSMMVDSNEALTSTIEGGISSCPGNRNQSPD